MAAGEGVFKSICIYGCDSEIDRRPYHRNCNCALHRSQRSNNGGDSSKNCPHGLPKSKTISFPMRKSWSEGCLALAAGNCSSAESSPAGSPAIGGVFGRRIHSHRRLSSLDEGEEDIQSSNGGVFFKI